MSGWRTFIGVATFWVAISFQASLADRLAIWGCKPEYVLVALACLSLYASRASGAVLGFFAGFLTGAVVGENMWQYVFSCALAGFLAGWFNTFEMKPNPWVAATVTGGVTLVARLAFLFIAPPHFVADYIKITIGMALYNCILAVPSYLLLTRLMGVNRQRYG